MIQPLIELHQVSKRYPNGSDALSPLSLKIFPGEFVFVTGHSGAGKSTLLRLLGLLERPTKGRILVNNIDLTKIKPHQVAQYRQRIGIITQNPLLLTERTAFENVAMPLYIKGHTRNEIAPRVRAALNRVGLAHKEQALPDTLSCGEQQRVGIARAIVHRPVLVLADEPTGNLDPDLALDVMSLFERFQQVGVTLIVASHDKAMINKMIAQLKAPRLLTLDHGHLVDNTLLERRHQDG